MISYLGVAASHSVDIFKFDFYQRNGRMGVITKRQNDITSILLVFTCFCLRRVAACYNSAELFFVYFGPLPAIKVRNCAANSKWLYGLAKDRR